MTELPREVFKREESIKPLRGCVARTTTLGRFIRDSWVDAEDEGGDNKEKPGGVRKQERLHLDFPEEAIWQCEQPCRDKCE